MECDFEIENGVLLNYHGNDKHVVIPKGLPFRHSTAECGFILLHNLDIIKIIDESVFENNCQLVSVVIPKTVEIIRQKAFCGCKQLECVALPEGLLSIGKKAFFGCDNLLSVTIPESVYIIEDDAFGGAYPSSNPNDLIIYGKSGSEAERYAKENGFTFYEVNNSGF